MFKTGCLAVSALVLAMLAAGCGGAQPGKVIVSYERESPVVPKLSVVETKGLYALFAGDGIAPLDAVYLFNGDQFGFVNRDGIVLGAYSKAGKTTTVPLDSVLTNEYVWKWQGDKQP